MIDNNISFVNFVPKRGIMTKKKTGRINRQIITKEKSDSRGNRTKTTINKNEWSDHIKTVFQGLASVLDPILKIKRW
jgi:hypothetical protein